MECKTKDDKGLYRSLDCWMEHLPESLHGTPLPYLAIPGSHDSCSYSINSNSEIAPDEPLLQNSILIHLLGCVSKRIIYKWSKTQSLSCTQQLECGVRYFDLRIASMSDSKDLYVVHGLYGALVVDILREIQKFLQSHTKEIVLLDFQHFYNMSQEDHHSLLNLLTETFGSLVCPFVTDIEKLTLSWLWQRNFRILLFYRNPIAKYHPFLWPTDYIPNPWGNTVNPKALLSFLSKNYQNGRPPDKFYVTQGVLTPTLTFIFCHLLGTLKSVLGLESNNLITEWLKDKVSGLNGLNVVICDFVDMEECRIPQLIIDLNYKQIQNTPENKPKTFHTAEKV
ncbi:PI-PLC X domain-containing protein 3-like [Centruroides sculpturatus]|uniref:PI-PLC X domain-containing protein 3-like n=1 Tax=Centruroides sculpturatus TaxID=218467 RepID=UPI000C6D3113|nr:PI-PLC X domain-containing protein 3-like [Centruroides sculpturatus]